jgi:N-acetyltransferase
LDDQGGLVVLDQAHGSIIGFSRYTTRFVSDGEVEIDWTFLARRFWGGEYNGELKWLMATHALRAWPIVVFRIGESNWRSRHAIEKIGAALIERTDMVASEGRQHRHVCYVMTRKGFAQSALTRFYPLAD